ncbi:hypothetical protein KRR38_11755 [Novosphingobium sp. G106]|uniref:hypothetical protein n=1 Tax=Novosphingobium sp. G106 TaxID=2849500 RepID=UPI001C2D9D40|nr:hypothetical protein [Novosphingobium sp. G106]MBV1688332.1 hypothetical protein [Novosphingobium sp. G106]
MSEPPPLTPPNGLEEFEERLASALGEAHKRKTAEGRWEAIQNWNEWFAANGPLLEEYLRLIDRRWRDR